jgi:hypothetical protein
MTRKPPSDERLRDLEKAMQRLRRSDTSVKRANALKAVKDAMKRLDSAVSKSYPKLRKDGSEVTPSKRRQYCHLCEVPIACTLGTHLASKHRLMERRAYNDDAGIPVGHWRCVCCDLHSTKPGIIRHLSSVDIKVHLAEYRLAQAAGATPKRTISGALDKEITRWERNTLSERNRQQVTE